MRSSGASRGAPAADGAGAVEDPALGDEEDLVRRRLLQLLLRPPEKRWGWSVRAGSSSAPVVVVAVLRPPENGKSGGGGPMRPRRRRGTAQQKHASARPRCTREGEGEDGSDGWDGRPGGRADLRDGREVSVFPRRNGQSAGRVNSAPSVLFTAAGTG
jgi:hypothetical protein